MDLDISIKGFNDLLHNGQTKAYAIIVDHCSPLELAKAIEQLGYVFCGDAYPVVDYVDHEQLADKLICHLDFDLASLLGELYCVFNKINQHLFKSAFVTHYLWDSI